MWKLEMEDKRNILTDSAQTGVFPIVKDIDRAVAAREVGFILNSRYEVKDWQGVGN